MSPFLETSGGQRQNRRKRKRGNEPDVDLVVEFLAVRVGVLREVVEPLESVVLVGDPDGVEAAQLDAVALGNDLVVVVFDLVVGEGGAGEAATFFRPGLGRWERGSGSVGGGVGKGRLFG